MKGKPEMNTNNGKQKILEVQSVKKYFPIEKGFFRKLSGAVKAVDNVTFYVNEGETLGLGRGGW